MYSILKTILALKLTFFLMIFGVGGSYVVEHSLLIPGIVIPFSGVTFVQTGSVQPVIKLGDDDDLQVNQTVNPRSRLCSVSDLRIEIEL